MKLYLNISTKLILTISLLTILIIVVISLVFLGHHQRYVIEKVRNGVGRLSDTIKRSTRYDMLIDHREGVYRMIDSIGKQDGIEVIRIFNKEGMIKFSTNKAEMGSYVDKNAEACYMCHSVEKPLSRLSTSERSRIFQSGDHRILAMITPIFNEPDCYNAPCHVHPKDHKVLGVLDIAFPLLNIDNDIRRNRSILIYFAIVSIFFVSSILALSVYRLIIMPVDQLLNATVRVARGDLNIEIPVNTRDEIGVLASSFNHMIFDLKKAREEIESLNIELEKKIEERTEKLAIAQEKLLQSEKMASMGVLASSVAHEINNPLQGMLTYVKLMIKIVKHKEIDQNRLEQFSKNLYLIEGEIKRCSEIVNSLLVFSRQSKPMMQESDVNDIIINSLLLLNNIVHEHNVDVELDIQDNIPQIFCDPKQIQQTLVALIINSIEAMPNGGSITLRTRSLNNDKVEISVADSGIGISEENLKKIFDPFFSTKDEAKSTGLGLSVAYGII